MGFQSWLPIALYIEEIAAPGSFSIAPRFLWPWSQINLSSTSTNKSTVIVMGIDLNVWRSLEN
jgi:hypothetical protein